MGNIVLLDDLTINKIAAGEVIERPASVVKEMLENSIDAGATNVNIEIQNGGISKIRISDNGKGIEPDDMIIAFERHATSKIRQADDLEYVRTMGFRGEALASIAAISKVEMVSRTMNSETGYKVVVEAGNIISEEMVAAPVGTTITVEKLFFNTPVRYKFLKKDYTEAGYIEESVKRIALVNSNMSIKLVNNGKTVIQTNGNGEIKDVIYGIYGREICEAVLPIDYKYENIVIKGVVGKPEIARSNRANQMFFINKRFVKDKTLSAAVEQAMKGMLPIGKFPFLVVNIEMDPKMVDVNVHPAKLEVRFVDESEIFKSVMYAIKETLLENSLIANVSKDEKTIESIYVKNNFIKTNKEDLNQQEINIEKEKNEFKAENRISAQDLEKASLEIEERTKTLTKNIVDLFKRTPKTDDEKDFGGGSVNIIGDIYKEKEEKLFKSNSENLTDKVNVEKTEEDVTVSDKVQEESDEYTNNNLYRFDDLKKIQTEVLKEIEEMPVLLNDNEVNEVEEIRDKIYLSRGESIESKEMNNMENKEENKAEITEETKENKVSNIVFETLEFKNRDNKISNEEFANEETVNLNIIKNEEEPKEEEPDSFEAMYEKTFGYSLESFKKQEKNFDTVQYAETENLSMFNENNEYSGYKYIGTAFSTYIMLEVNQELYMLDQHAAHERIMYEQVKENYYSSNKDCQIMLLPDVIELTNNEMCVLNENIKVFENAGFKVEEFGDKTIKLVGVPSLCMEMDTKSLFLDILDEIDNVARTERQEIEERFIATVACKSAVKGNMHLEVQEVVALLDKLMKLPNPFTCPHGRPTAIKMTKNDIERKFSRR